VVIEPTPTEISIPEPTPIPIESNPPIAIVTPEPTVTYIATSTETPTVAPTATPLITVSPTTSVSESFSLKLGDRVWLDGDRGWEFRIAPKGLGRLKVGWFKLRLTSLF